MVVTLLKSPHKFDCISLIHSTFCVQNDSKREPCAQNHSYLKSVKHIKYFPKIVQKYRSKNYYKNRSKKSQIPNRTLWIGSHLVTIKVTFVLFFSFVHNNWKAINLVVFQQSDFKLLSPKILTWKKYFRKLVYLMTFLLRPCEYATRKIKIL